MVLTHFRSFFSYIYLIFHDPKRKMQLFQSVINELKLIFSCLLQDMGQHWLDTDKIMFLLYVLFYTRLWLENFHGLSLSTLTNKKMFVNCNQHKIPFYQFCKPSVRWTFELQHLCINLKFLITNKFLTIGNPPSWIYHWKVISFSHRC